MMEVVFQPFSPILGHMIIIENFLYEFGDNFISFGKASSLADILRFFLYEIVTFCKACSSIIFYAVLEQFQHCTIK